MKNLVKKFRIWFSNSKRNRPKTRMEQLAEIEVQMDFWHREEMRTLTESQEAFAKGDFVKSKMYWQQHLVACHRAKMEVSDKLDNFHQSRS